MPPLLQFLSVLLLGIAVGGVAGWLLALRRASARGTDERLENELRQQVAARDQELGRMREQLSEARSAAARQEAGAQAAAQTLEQERVRHQRELQERKESMDKALADLREAFKALSTDALRQTQPEFLRLATSTLEKFHETARGDLAQRQQAIATLVEPLKQHLETYQQRLQQSETAQSTALGEVRKHLDSLAQQSQLLAGETMQFRRVLSSSQARGRWGEETLRRVVEAAGMSAHCDFTEQERAGDSKPDLVVRLPGDRMILVDSKVPDLDFLGALDAADPEKRSAALTAHATKLKATIKALADRDYPRQFQNSLDYVVLFLPAESLFSAALEGDRELIVWAAEKRILIATPASLIALLRSVSVCWQQQSQTENARAIAEAAQELFARIAKFTEHFGRLRDGLSNAVQSYNDAVGSYERMVRPSGERLAKLAGGMAGKALADVTPLDKTLRQPS
jgi:DNA recombination protein RmuC